MKKQKNTNRSYFFFSSYCPLQILVLQTCNKNISKTVIASSFKHGQLIEDNDYYLIKIKHKLFYFMSYCPLQIFALQT